jgi:peptidyl-prolyl cis-trans isomerase D
MFDLFRSRDKVVKIFLGGLLVVVALSMLTYLVPSYEQGSSQNGTVVAQVGDQKIMSTDIQRAVQRLTQGRSLPPELLPNYIPTIIDQEIDNRAIQYEAARQGFQVTDAQLRQTIAQIAPSLFPDGRFVGKQAYQQILAQQNTTIEEFEAGIRNEILAARLHDIAVEGTVVTPLEIEQAYKQKNEKISLGYVKIASEKLKGEVQPSEAEVRQFYQTNIAQFQAPEKKNLTLLIADQAKLEQALKPGDADLLKIYNQNQEQYRIPEQVKVQHVLFMTQGKPPADDAKIKAQAEDVLKQIKAGADFSAMVEKYSEDPGKSVTDPSADGYHGQYTIRRDSTMFEAFKKAAFDQQPGEVALIKDEAGYRIVKVLKHDQAHLQTFDEVKTQLATVWKNAQVNAVLQAASDAAPALQAAPLHPEDVAAKFHMDVVHAVYEPGKTITEVGPNGDFDQAVQQLKQGQVSGAIVVGNNKVVVAEVASVIPPAPKPFDEVKEAIKSQMVTSRLAAAVSKRAKELADKAKGMGGNLEAAAKSMGLTYAATDPFTRTDTVNGLGSANYVLKGFGSKDGDLMDPVMMPDATVVCKVLSHVQADASKMTPEERTQTRDQIKGRKAEDRRKLFDAGLREQLIREGKIKLYQDAINQLITRFRAG